MDSDEGEPSCVIRSGSDLITVRSSVSIADAAWHRGACAAGTRDGVSIEVDGTVDREAGAPARWSAPGRCASAAPGVGDDDDQFHGRIDDVYLHVASDRLTVRQAGDPVGREQLREGLLGRAPTAPGAVLARRRPS